jgi:hypothetical protein
MRIMEQLGFFTALGIVIVFIAAVALGRIASVPSGIREVEEVPETTVPADTVPVETIRDERVRDETVRDETVRDETVRNETDRGETVSSEETRPAHTRLLPRRKTEDTTQTVG